MDRNIRRVSCIGSGLIGAGWAAHFLRAGLEVNVYDPAAERESYVRDYVNKAWPTLQKIGLAAGASPQKLKFTSAIDVALENTDFVQESAIEDRDAKVSILADLDRRLPPEVVIASSSSGFLASDLRAKATYGHRIIIGHPFNPPFLVPLVEIAGGDGASEAAAKAARIYRGSGCEVVELKKEIDGYIGNRIQFAVFREILYLMSQGVADLATLDRAVKSGPALRWAVLGPSAVFFLGARNDSLYPEFVQLLSHELESGYVAPPTFKPDSALMKRYAEEVLGSIGAGGQEQMISHRDAGVAAIRNVLDSLNPGDANKRS